MAIFQKWYFNKESGHCEEFTFGGCGGNANRFDTKQSCEGVCVFKTGNINFILLK